MRVKFQTVFWHNRVIATYSTCPAVISSVQCYTYVAATVPCPSLTPMLVIFVACSSMLFASLSWFSALLLDILQRFFYSRTFLLPTVTHYDCSAPSILVPEVHQLIQKTLSSSNIFQRGQIWLVIDLASLMIYLGSQYYDTGTYYYISFWNTAFCKWRKIYDIRLELYAYKMISAFVSTTFIFMFRGRLSCCY